MGSPPVPNLVRYVHTRRDLRRSEFRGPLPVLL